MSDDNKWYESYIQLYTQELAAIGQRSQAFLVGESIMVTAFVTLIANQRSFPVAFDLLSCGLTLIAILYCIFHFLAGESGAQAAFIWREMAESVEKAQEHAPFTEFWNRYEAHKFNKKLANRPPLPHAWLTTPALFLILWLGVIGYAVANYVSALEHPTLRPFHQELAWLFWILVSAGVVSFVIGIVLVVKGWRKWRSTNNTSRGNPSASRNDDGGGSHGSGDAAPIQSSISKREFLTTGIVFFFFSLALYIAMGAPFEVTLWNFTWHAPDWASTVQYLISIIVLVIGSFIAASCLVGAFSPKTINNLLNKLAEHRSLMNWGKYGYTILFSLAFMLNFFLSWVQKLVGVAKTPTVFYLIFAVGIIFLGAIIASQERRR